VWRDRVSGGNCQREVRDVLVEALEEVADDRLDHRAFVLVAGERLDGVERFPHGRDNHFRRVFQRAHQHVRAEEPLSRHSIRGVGRSERV
jgi:hypothetical protein